MAETVNSTSQYQSLLLSELGQDVNSDLAAYLPLLWQRHSRKGAIHPDLQYLYTKRSAIDYLLGQGVEDVKYSQQDVSEDPTQAGKNLLDLRKLVSEEIVSLEEVLLSGGLASVGQITKKTPITVNHGPNPNSRRLRGDPIAGRRWPWGW